MIIITVIIIMIIIIIISIKIIFHSVSYIFYPLPENTCGNTIQCYYGGQQDPSNCNQCICPEERTGSQCQAVAEGSGGN